MRGILGGVAAFVLSLPGCNDGVRLGPGMGGLRVRLGGARAGQHATVSIRTGYPTNRPPAFVRETTAREVMFVDVAPAFYDVVAYTDDGRGGYYHTWGGNGGAEVEAGRVTTVDVDLATGIAVTGRVLDATTHQPLDHVNVAPAPHLGSTTWPVTLPGLWAESRPDGRFVIGGVEPYVPMVPGEPPGDRVRGWIEFSRDGYVSRRVVLDPPDRGPPRTMEVRLDPAPPAVP